MGTGIKQRGMEDSRKGSKLCGGYGDSEEFDNCLATQRDCEWFVSCKVLSGICVDWSSYSLIEFLYGTITYNKLVEVLTKNYNINKSTAKDVIKKWKQLEKTRWRKEGE